MNSEKFKIIPTMVFHQMHYFSYCYVLPCLFYLMLKDYGYSDISACLIAAFMFAFSWVVYLMPQWISEKSTKKINYFQIFLAGHSILALIMLAMSWLSYMKMYTPLVILWCLTGFGGGTVFCIQHLSTEYEKTDLKFSEDIGHALGTIFSIGICCCFDDNVWLFASMCCLIAGIFVCLTIGFGCAEHYKDTGCDCIGGKKHA